MSPRDVEGELFPGTMALSLVQMVKTGATWQFDRTAGRECSDSAGHCVYFVCWTENVVPAIVIVPLRFFGGPP